MLLQKLYELYKRMVMWQRTASSGRKGIVNQKKTNVSGYKFSKRSITALEGVHPDLVAVTHRALELSPIDFVVLEGLRSVTRQKKLVEAGASQTMNSRHLTGHAIDVGAWIDGGIQWQWALYDAIAVAFKQAAGELEVEIEWGGDWQTFKDGGHFQLSKRKYP